MAWVEAGLLPEAQADRREIGRLGAPGRAALAEADRALSGATAADAEDAGALKAKSGKAAAPRAQPAQDEAGKELKVDPAPF